MNAGNIAKGIVALISVRAALWAKENVPRVIETDGFFGVLLIVLAALAAVLLSGLVGFLIVEAFTEMEKDDKAKKETGQEEQVKSDDTHEKSS